MRVQGLIHLNQDTVRTYQTMWFSPFMQSDMGVEAIDVV